MNPILDFNIVDDLSLATSDQIKRAKLKFDATDLGAATEYEFLRAFSGAAIPPLPQVSDSIIGCAVSQRLAEQRVDVANLSIQAQSFEFTCVPQILQDNVFWNAFKRRMADAGSQAGFDGLTAKGFVGAFGELIGNVFDHSGEPATAVAGYQHSQGKFQLVVADAGKGVLASLQTNPVYSQLRDDGQALLVAIASGETRFGRGSGRGTGFDTVFRNLASLSGNLRFRSGDHSCEVRGTSPTAGQAQVRQRARFAGFLVSVACQV